MKCTVGLNPQDGAKCTLEVGCQVGTHSREHVIKLSLTKILKFLSSSQVNGYDMTMVTHDYARKRLTKKSEVVVRLLVTRKSLEQAVKQSMGPKITPKCDNSVTRHY